MTAEIVFVWEAMQLVALARTYGSIGTTLFDDVNMILDI